MKKIALLFVIILASSQITFSQTAEEFTIEDRLFDPWYIHHLSDDTLIVVDLRNSDQAIQLRTLPDGEIIRSQRTGSGPGEVSNQGAKIVNTTEDHIYVWDAAAREFLQYDRQLNYRNSFFTDSPLMYVAPLGDSLAVGSMSRPSKNFLHIYKTRSRELEADPVTSFSVKEDSRLEPIQSRYLLRQGPFLTNSEELFMGFTFSSLVLQVTPDRLERIISEPANIPLPEYRSTSVEDGSRIDSAPNIDEYPHGTLDVAVDDEYLYVLHSGKKLEAGRLRQVWLQASGKMAEEIENIEYNNQVFVYDRENGKYIGEIFIPQKAKKITVSDTYLTILSINEEGIPFISGLEKQSFVEKALNDD